MNKNAVQLMKPYMSSSVLQLQSNSADLFLNSPAEQFISQSVEEEEGEEEEMEDGERKGAREPLVTLRSSLGALLEN